MIFIKNTPLGYNVRKYLDYVEANKNRFSASTLEYIRADWHYDTSSNLCPHDSWLMGVAVDEIGTGPRRERRSTGVKMKFLGAYHDIEFLLEYDGVTSYEISCNRSESHSNGAGDWLVDEIVLDDHGSLFTHEIMFSNDAKFVIKGKNILHRVLQSGESFG
jgi:hypothetical protein